MGLRPRTAETGLGFFGEDAASPSLSARGLGERCKLPKRVPGRSSGKFGFCSIWGPQKSSERSASFWIWRGKKCPRPNVEPPLLKFVRQTLHYTTAEGSCRMFYLCLSLQWITQKVMNWFLWYFWRDIQWPKGHFNDDSDHDPDTRVFKGIFTYCCDSVGRQE